MDRSERLQQALSDFWEAFKALCIEAMILILIAGRALCEIARYLLRCLPFAFRVLSVVAFLGGILTAIVLGGPAHWLLWVAWGLFCICLGVLILLVEDWPLPWRLYAAGIACAGVGVVYHGFDPVGQALIVVGLLGWFEFTNLFEKENQNVTEHTTADDTIPSPEGAAIEKPQPGGPLYHVRDDSIPADYDPVSYSGLDRQLDHE